MNWLSSSEPHQREKRTMQVEFSFDDGTFRHYINGQPSVLHCHHYMALTTKVATTFRSFGADQILAESTEDSMRVLFDDYNRKHLVPQGPERLRVAGEYYAVMGLGRLQLEGNASGGTVTLQRSHVDEGWVKKFGVSDQPINHVTRGYAAAAFASAFDRPARAYVVTESSSMAMGAGLGTMVVSEGGPS
jgi:hypothetical protein